MGGRHAVPMEAVGGRLAGVAGAGGGIRAGQLHAFAADGPSLDLPDDITVDWTSAAPVVGTSHRAGPRSVVVLAARRPAESSTRRTTA
jgi:hypothetical protein